MQGRCCILITRLPYCRFVNEAALQQHLWDKIHTPTRKTRKGLLCDKCDRGFLSQATLMQYQRSLVHCPLSNLECTDSRC
ncbi:hypothetical protein BJX66DRAFT_308356 [Aspergillus keveii]|uniref:C2H2-type domain-containing protein n=1 Tax=Aspergillus keveii TaxID=714993 RepID=A0ABR4FZQ0_9EURO